MINRTDPMIHCEPLTPVVKQWRPFEFTKEMME